MHRSGRAPIRPHRDVAVVSDHGAATSRPSTCRVRPFVLRVEPLDREARARRIAVAANPIVLAAIHAS
jgi:hypothetical protein